MDVLVLGSFFVERKEQRGRNKVQGIGTAKVDAADGNDADGIPAEAYAIGDRLGKKFRADQVYLFGSYARRSAGPDSDLDFLVVVPESQKSRYQRAIEARGYIRGASLPIGVIVMTRAEWDRDLEAVCSLASTVKREGKMLSGQ